MAEESNQEEKDVKGIFDDENQEDETGKSNSQKGEDSDDVSLSPEQLAKYNERSGKSYKSLTLGQLAEKEKIADEAYRSKTVVPAKPKAEPKPKPSAIDDEVVEELLLTKHPEAEYNLEEIRDAAKLKGISVLKAFRESKYLQGEAKSLADAKKEEEEVKGRIASPSNGAGGGGGNKSFANIDLSNKSDVAWLGAKEGRRQEYMDWYATHK